MAKQKKKINKIDSTNLILYIAYGVVTLTAIVFIVLLTFAPFKVTSYDSLQQVEYKEYDNQKDEAYFVLIYDESRPNSDWNLEVVMQIKQDFIQNSYQSMVMIYKKKVTANLKVS